MSLTTNPLLGDLIYDNRRIERTDLERYYYPPKRLQFETLAPLEMYPAGLDVTIITETVTDEPEPLWWLLMSELAILPTNSAKKQPVRIEVPSLLDVDYGLFSQEGRLGYDYHAITTAAKIVSVRGQNVLNIVTYRHRELVKVTSPPDDLYELASYIQSTCGFYRVSPFRYEKDEWCNPVFRIFIKRT